jgi:ATP-dependent Lon protease
VVTYSHAEYDFYRSQPKEEQDHIAKQEAEVRTATVHNAMPMRFRVLASRLPPHAMASALKKAIHLSRLDARTPEYHKERRYLEAMLSIPVGVYRGGQVAPAYDCLSNHLMECKRRMDAAIFGHDSTKHAIMRLLAQRFRTPGTVNSGLVLGIHGPPGVGKTSLVQHGVCAALGVPLAFVPLGGVHDASHLKGFDYTYEGSRPGKIVECVTQAGCLDPVFLFDEIDKSGGPHASGSGRYDVQSVLVHLLDNTQNTRFRDNHFSELDVDLSRAVMVCTFNDPSMVSPVLLDRMTCIRVEGYTMEQKVSIARSHLLPAIAKRYGIAEVSVAFSAPTLRYAVSVTPREDGVRGLKRTLDDVYSTINMCLALTDDAVDATFGPGSTTASIKGVIAVALVSPSRTVHVTDDMVDEAVQHVRVRGAAPPMSMYS